jgi:hypothetical protein
MTMSLRTPAFALFLLLALSLASFAQSGEISDAKSLREVARGLAAFEIVGENEVIRLRGGKEGISLQLAAIVPGSSASRLKLTLGDDGAFLADADLFRLPAPEGFASRLTSLHAHWKGEETPELQHLPILGWVLVGPVSAVDESGRSWNKRRDANQLRIEELVAAVEKSKRRLQGVEVSPLARKAISHILDQVPLSAAPSDEEHVTPELARRMLLDGVIRQSLGPQAEAILAELDRELRRATATREGAVWTCASPAGGSEASLRLAFTEDGFGERELRLWRGEQLLAAQHRMPNPSFAPARTPLTTSLTFAPDGVKIAEAAIWSQSRRLGTWTEGEHLRADRELWRLVLPDDRASSFSRVAENFMPPHLVALDRQGDIVFLATETGTVSPPRRGSQEERDRFIAEAAKALPSVAHLDLVGQYFFAYVHDSPDPTLPWLVGHEGAIGEIHQSVEQTLSTASGGVCRGDCDDLAELYQALTRAQGKISHIMAVPGHNALAWADQDSDTERWTVRVLHTGPPLEFKSRRLERALGYAYKHFGVFENFDPDQCLVAVRFSGENTRSTWALGWRIFRDAEYAETMIDVQRDWHFHTFSRGFAKMKALIASGDEDVANYRELSGLSERIGRFDEAVRWLEKAMERSTDDRLTLMSRMTADLYAAEKPDQAAAVLEKAAARLDKLGERRGATRVALAFELAQLVFSAEDSRPFLPIVEKHLVDSVGAQIEGLAQLLADGRIDDETWRREPQIAEIRRIARDYATIGTQLVLNADAETRAKSKALARIARQTEVWCSVLGFRDPNTEGLGSSPSFAEVGELARASFGAELFDAMIARAPMPEAGSVPPLAGRAASQLQLAADLPWIKASPSYWSGQIFQLFRRDAAKIDGVALARLRAGYEAALAADLFPEVRSTQLADLVLGRTAFLFALLDGDEAGVRRHLERVARLNDKNVRDDAVSLLAATAKFLPDATWTKTLALWDEIIGNKASYYALAWEAMSARAPARALEAGKLAARRFPDDPAFQEELQLLKEQVERAQKTAAN